MTSTSEATPSTSSGGGGGSVMREMDETETELKNLYYRLETLEKSLRFRPMTTEEREVMEADVEELRQILNTQEKNLKRLRGDNRNSMAFAVVLLIGTFLLYGLYSMIFRNF